MGPCHKKSMVCPFCLGLGMENTEHGNSDNVVIVVRVRAGSNIIAYVVYTVSNIYNSNIIHTMLTYTCIGIRITMTV